MKITLLKVFYMFGNFLTVSFALKHFDPGCFCYYFHFSLSKTIKDNFQHSCYVSIMCAKGIFNILQYITWVFKVMDID